MAASPRFLELLEKMKDIHIRKNAGYSGKDNPDTFANFRRAEDWGVKPSIGCLIRLSDKYSRASSLIKNPQNEQVGETFEDTMVDLANYCLIYLCLREEEENENK